MASPFDDDGFSAPEFGADAHHPFHQHHGAAEHPGAAHGTQPVELVALCIMCAVGLCLQGFIATRQAKTYGGGGGGGGGGGADYATVGRCRLTPDFRS